MQSFQSSVELQRRAMLLSILVISSTIQLNSVTAFEVFTDRNFWINAVSKRGGTAYTEPLRTVPEDLQDMDFLPGVTKIKTDESTFKVEVEMMESFQGVYNNFFFEPVDDEDEDYYIILKITDAENSTMPNTEVSFMDFTRRGSPAGDLFAYGADYLSTVPNATLTDQAATVLTINGLEVNFRDYLPFPGSGFLGVVLDEGDTFDKVTYTKDINDNGQQFFVDDLIFGYPCDFMSMEYYM